MCLQLLENNNEYKIAENDITVYKTLVKWYYVDFDETKIKDNDKFIAIILGYECEGKIHISPNNDILLFIPRGYYNNLIEGIYNLDKNFSNNISSLIINDEELIKIKEIEFITPYRGRIIKENILFDSKLVKEYYECYVIEDGLHSFKNIDDCKNNLLTKDSIIYKCIIPKDSTYYEGTFNNIEGLVSDKLKYIEIIN